MSDFDPARKLTMARFKTVHGHGLQAGTALAIVEEPAAAGEVDEAMARRLWNAGIAVYAEDFRPTPVETKEQEAARLTAGETASPDTDESAIEGDQIEVQSDLRVSNSALRKIAEDEGIAVESDDNKADLQRKIMEGRAAKATQTDAAPETHPLGS